MYMQAVSIIGPLTERRSKTSTQKDVLWDKLSLAQKFSVSSLIQFGYELTYIRDSKLGSLVILLCNHNVATISNEGEVDSSPNITLRA